MTDKERIEEMAKPFTDFEKELLNELYEGLGIQDWRDECIWKTARVENCAIRLAKKYQSKLPARPNLHIATDTLPVKLDTAREILKLVDKKLDLHRNSVIGGNLYDDGYKSAVQEIKFSIKKLYGVEVEE